MELLHGKCELLRGINYQLRAWARMLSLSAGCVPVHCDHNSVYTLFVILSECLLLSPIIGVPLVL